MKTTPRNSIPYPEQGDSPNEATAMANLVGQIDRRMVPRFTNAADRTSRVPSPTEGMYGYRNDVHRFEIYRGGAWQPAAFGRTVVKTDNTVRTLTTTPTADPHLQIDKIYSGRTYLIETMVVYQADTGVDLSLRFGGPTISQGSMYWFLQPSAENTGSNTLVGLGSLDVASLPTVSLTLGGSGLSQTSSGLLRGIFTASADGAFSVQWSQAVSSALNTTVFAGSYLSVSMLS